MAGRDAGSDGSHVSFFAVRVFTRVSGCHAEDDCGDYCMVSTIFKDVAENDDAAGDGHENDRGAGDDRTSAVQIFHEAAHL